LSEKPATDTSEIDHEESNANGMLVHLAELRRRVVISVVVYLIGVMVLMNYSDQVFDYIAQPLRSALPPGTPLIFLSAPDLFFTYLKIALVVSLFVTAPVTLYQFWAFVAPGLYRHERRLFASYFLSSLTLLLAGGAFAFYVVFPLIFKFFIGFSTETIQALPAIKEYLSLVLKLLFAFGVSFQIPVVMMLLVKMDVVDVEALVGQRRYVIVWVFVFAALLTPPDVISQILLGVPMLLLYELGILLAKVREGRHA